MRIRLVWSSLVWSGLVQMTKQALESLAQCEGFFSGRGSLSTKLKCPMGDGRRQEQRWSLPFLPNTLLIGAGSHPVQEVSDTGRFWEQLWKQGKQKGFLCSSGLAVREAVPSLGGPVFGEGERQSVCFKAMLAEGNHEFNLRMMGGVTQRR